MALDRFGEIWESHHFSGEELPCLQDVLRSCDREALLRTIADNQISLLIPAGEVQARGMMEASVRLSLDALCSLELDAPSPNLVFIPKASYVLNARKLTLLRFVDAVLVPADGLLSVARYRAAMGGQVSRYSQAEQAIREASRALQEEGRDCNPDGIPFAFHAAEDVLSYRVWIPSGWCAYEKYAFLAAILWEHLNFDARSLVGFLSHQAVSVSDSNVRANDPLAEPCQMHVTYRRKMAEIVGALNHNAFLDCLDDQIELGGRLGLIV